MATTIRAAERRRTKTPNATMTTFASPTLGSTGGLSLWQVEMEPGAAGPLHVFDREQLWTVVVGEVSITVDGAPAELGAGDTIVIPARVERQVRAGSVARLIVCGPGDAVATTPGEDASRGVPPWIA